MRTVPCPLPPEELQRLVTEAKLTDKEIAASLPGATIKRVQAWRRRYSIEAIPRWSRNEVVPIEGKLKSLLVGSMLGDGRIVRQPNASYYTESHCGSQRAYLEWKAALWGQWLTKPVVAVPDKRKYEQVRLYTCAHESLNSWQALFYADPKKGWKRLLPQIVDEVDAFALTIWYLDDGCASWWPDITFGADEASRQVALAIFEKFGLKPRWQAKVGKTGEFHFEREDTAERFLEIIRPHVPACMAYKLGPFGFQGQHYQVRQKLDQATLAAMAATGMPIKKMARELGVAATTISRRLIEWGISHPRQTGRPAPSVGAYNARGLARLTVNYFDPEGAQWARPARVAVVPGGSPPPPDG